MTNISIIQTVEFHHLLTFEMLQVKMPEPVVDDTATAESETAAALFGGNDNE